jgi:hypothetical protein
LSDIASGPRLESWRDKQSLFFDCFALFSSHHHHLIMHTHSDTTSRTTDKNSFYWIPAFLTIPSLHPTSVAQLQTHTTTERSFRPSPILPHPLQDASACLIV